MTDIKDKTRTLAPMIPMELALACAWATSCVEAEATGAHDRDEDLADAETPGETTEKERSGVLRSGATGADLERELCGPNDMQYVNAYAGDLGVTKDYVREHKGPVGAMATSDRPEEGYKFCSGTLVATNVFLTASVCVDAKTVGRFVTMNYELSQGKGTSLLEEQFYRIEAVLVEDVDRDFALLRLQGDPGATFGWTDIRETEAVADETIVIIQHPMGGPKQFDAGRVSEVAPEQFSYDADTRSGSAGAGVLDADGLLVGIHTTGGCVAGEGAGKNFRRLYLARLERLE
ncbi:trypsin-like serine peptidase [Nannocystis pusilla]|uniref:trypsin-like serine peptidase n=1 Tax=Nannocystis pusilla TaxID=889268 RepID=UPI003DA43C47